MFKFILILFIIFLIIRLFFSVIVARLILPYLKRRLQTKIYYDYVKHENTFNQRHQQDVEKEVSISPNLKIIIPKTNTSNPKKSPKISDAEQME